MASAAAAPAPAQTSSRTKPIPAALVPAAVVLAVVVAVLSLLPSVAQAVWEVPHLLLLGLVVAYGVFAQQRNSVDAAEDDGARAWSSRYRPDDPLVVVAPDHAAGDDGVDGASERPLSLPVRRLKPVVEESEAGGASDGGIGEETDSCASASTADFWAGAPPAAPSPPSVLDGFESREYSATTPPSAVSKGFPGYDSPSPRDQSSCNEDEEDQEEEEEGTDWDEDADGSEEMTAPSERSFPGDFVACRNRRYNGADDGDGESVDEELIELAGPAEGVDEVDRKADEFIAKFREQIRLQKSRQCMA